MENNENKDVNKENKVVKTSTASKTAPKTSTAKKTTTSKTSATKNTTAPKADEGTKKSTTVTKSTYKATTNVAITKPSKAGGAIVIKKSATSKKPKVEKKETVVKEAPKVVEKKIESNPIDQEKLKQELRAQLKEELLAEVNANINKKENIENKEIKVEEETPVKIEKPNIEEAKAKAIDESKEEIKNQLRKELFEEFEKQKALEIVKKQEEQKALEEAKRKEEQRALEEARKIEDANRFEEIRKQLQEIKQQQTVNNENNATKKVVENNEVVKQDEEEINNNFLKSIEKKKQAKKKGYVSFFDSAENNDDDEIEVSKETNPKEIKKDKEEKIDKEIEVIPLISKKEETPVIEQPKKEIKNSGKKQYYSFFDDIGKARQNDEYNYNNVDDADDDNDDNNNENDKNENLEEQSAEVDNLKNTENNSVEDNKAKENTENSNLDELNKKEEESKQEEKTDEEKEEQILEQYQFDFEKYLNNSDKMIASIRIDLENKKKEKELFDAVARNNQFNNPKVCALFIEYSLKKKPAIKYNEISKVANTYTLVMANYYVIRSELINKNNKNLKILLNNIKNKDKKSVYYTLAKLFISNKIVDFNQKIKASVIKKVEDLYKRNQKNFTNLDFNEFMILLFDFNNANYGEGSKKGNLIKIYNDYYQKNIAKLTKETQEHCLCKLAENYIGNKQYKKAIKIYNDMLEVNPSSFNALSGIILCKKQKRSFEELFLKKPFKQIPEFKEILEKAHKENNLELEEEYNVFAKKAIKITKDAKYQSLGKGRKLFNVLGIIVSVLLLAVEIIKYLSINLGFSLDFIKSYYFYAGPALIFISCLFTNSLKRSLPGIIGKIIMILIFIGLFMFYPNIIALIPGLSK